MATSPAHVAHPPQSIHNIDDPESGLSGVIVIHSTRLGPAAGGCRLWRYDTALDATADAIRLAEGMSYKNAMAGLPLGGGKAVLRMPAGNFDRPRLFEAFGRAVAQLGGAYVTAEDVGTTVADMDHVSRHTGHVAGLARREGESASQPGGDPSPWTALGVFTAMEVGAARLGRPLRNATVAVQGLGNVGMALCERLRDAGARLIVADPRRERTVFAAARFRATVVPPEEILSVKAHILAPCALGGVLDCATIKTVRARLVCGGANNQLATPENGDLLAARGVLYVPDYVANAGGIINVAAEYLGWSVSDVAARVAAIGARVEELLDAAAAAGMAPSRMADIRAREIIAAGPSSCPKNASRASCVVGER
jgi:leucine dehydrogenase